MPQKRKLQVFVSSTFEDLKPERQAAVEAILGAGHIPAGMELFTAGDESQMNVIKRWIDESDIYMLILGGRYGSIEPKSGKSYIHLEYEYALEQGKPFFSLVITDAHLDAKVRDLGRQVFENSHPQELDQFRSLVKSGAIVKFWDDLKDIKIFTAESLRDLSDRPDLKGWVRGDEAADAGAMAQEMRLLSEENRELREQIARLQDASKFNAPMPELNVSLEILKGEADWYEILADEKENFPGALNYRSPLEAKAKLVAREGFWMRIEVTNSGSLATDMNISVACSSPIVRQQDIEAYEERHGYIEPIVKRDGWNKAHFKENEAGHSWEFQGSLYSLKAGQKNELIIPLVDEVYYGDFDDVEIELDVFPETGNHIHKTYKVNEVTIRV